MRGVYRLLGAAFAALVPWSPAHAQLAGECFDARLGQWSAIAGTHTLSGDPSPPPDQSRDSVYYAFPPRILLTDSVSSEDPNLWFRVEVPEGALPVPKSYQVWRREGDSVRIVLSDGFSSVRSVLVAEDDRWAGTLRTRSDNVGRQLYKRSIELRRVDCESAPPIAASAQVPAPRRVQGQSGGDLELGSPVPPGYTLGPVSERSGFEAVEHFVPAGYWVGAMSVHVRRTTDGRIAQIYVRYPEEFDYSALQAGLVADFGPGRDGAPWLSWENRSTRSFLQTDNLGRVVLYDPRLGR